VADRYHAASGHHRLSWLSLLRLPRREERKRFLSAKALDMLCDISTFWPTWVGSSLGHTVEPAERTGSGNQRFGPDDSVRLACSVTGCCLPVQPGQEETSRAVKNASVGAPLRRRL